MSKKTFNSLVVGFFAGILGSFLVGVLAFAFVVSNENKLIDFVLQKSAEQMQEILEKGTAKELEERNIITQESLLISAIEKANPAVVSIVITKDVPILERYYEQLPFGFNDPFFGDIFGDQFFSVPRYREKGTEKREVGGGSGFLVSEDGLVVTNKHVVRDKEAEYTVFTNDGEKYEAEVLARDPVNDIAVLKIKSDKKFSYLSFADSDKIKLGQTAIAIGNALGEFRNTVSVGIVSGLARSVVAGDDSGMTEQLEGVIQTDAAINPGNSGGPLLDLKGRVIGVNTAVARGSENIGFALPANLVKSIVESVKEYGKIIRPYLGVRYILINEAIKEKNKLKVDYGALIVRGEKRDELAVIPGSPADKAGILENDIILEVDGQKIKDGKTLAQIIRNKKVGDKVRLKILSKGKEKEIEVVLEEMPE